MLLVQYACGFSYIHVQGKSFLPQGEKRCNTDFTGHAEFINSLAKFAMNYPVDMDESSSANCPLFTWTKFLFVLVQDALRD